MRKALCNVFSHWLRLCRAWCGKLAHTRQNTKKWRNENCDIGTKYRPISRNARTSCCLSWKHNTVKTYFSRQYTCRSLRCSWNIVCRCCSYYIVILDLTSGFTGSCTDNCWTRRKSLKFWDLLRLILYILRYLHMHIMAWRIPINRVTH